MIKTAYMGTCVAEFNHALERIIELAEEFESSTIKEYIDKKKMQKGLKEYANTLADCLCEFSDAYYSMNDASSSDISVKGLVDVIYNINSHKWEDAKLSSAIELPNTEVLERCGFECAIFDSKTEMLSIGN